MASTARRSVVGGPATARGGSKPGPNAENPTPEEVRGPSAAYDADREGEDATEHDDSENTRLHKRLVQMQYLEQEN